MTRKSKQCTWNIRADIKSSSFLGMKPVYMYIHFGVCDKYGDGQMYDTSFSTRVAKFKRGTKHFKDASRPASVATNNNTLHVYQTYRKTQEIPLGNWVGWEPWS